MIRAAWVELPYDRHRKVWDRFEAAFAFRPSVGPGGWPSFREPAPSLTWDVRDLLSAFNPWADTEATPYNLALLAALRQCVPAEEPVLALDWHHAAYQFYPHRFRGAEEPTNWLVPALPSGEYHLFVTADHRLGSLGHPWEGTLCVFGEGFLEAYARLTPLGPERVRRRKAAGPPAESPRHPKRRGGQSSPRRRPGPPAGGGGR
jgi:Protein of unknown function (DUF2716)